VRTTLDIIYGVTGQTVYHDCAEGRPSSVTSATVYAWDATDDSDGEDAIGAASVETGPSTTIDAASGFGQADPRVLYVAATTSAAIDRRYLVTAADGQREWFDVEEIDSGNSITAKHPLFNAYASADTVQSTRIQATIDSTWVADTANVCGDDANPGYRIRWVYVVNGVTYVADSYFNLVRYVGKHGVRPQDVELTFPGWLDRLPTDHREDQGRKLIDEAYRQVKIDLAAVEIDDASVANAEIVDELTRWKTLAVAEMARFMMNGQSEAAYAAAKQAYQERLDSLVRLTTKVPVRDASGAAQPKTSLGLTRR